MAVAGKGTVVQAFRRWDAEGSGLIPRGELLRLIRRLDPAIAEEDLDALFGAAGFQDGTRLNYEEFLGWLWSDLGVGGADAAEAEARAEAAREAARAQGLWEGSLAAARARGGASFAAAPVQRYFDEVEARLRGEEYLAHVRGSLFTSTDADRDGRVSLADAATLIGKSLKCAADLGCGPPPTSEEIRASFSAHDTLAEGRGYMGADEFLGLVRYLQVRVAEAMLPFSQLVRSG